MNESPTKSHFWVAGPPLFTSTILVASAYSDKVGNTLPATFVLFDGDGVLIQSFQVEFPQTEVGVIEVEPFMAGLKMQSGLVHGHLVVESRAGTRHLCRQQIGLQSELIAAPRELSNREMAFMPLILGGGREHLLVGLNTGEGDAQLVVRLMYGNRSPEWTVQIPGNGCRLVSVEDELLASFDDSSWQKGVVQGYLRISPRAQASVVCQMIERVPAFHDSQECYRTLSSL